jgi:hypothetical protein
MNDLQALVEGLVKLPFMGWQFQTKIIPTWNYNPSMSLPVITQEFLVEAKASTYFALTQEEMVQINGVDPISAKMTKYIPDSIKPYIKDIVHQDRYDVTHGSTFRVIELRFVFPNVDKNFKDIEEFEWNRYSTEFDKQLESKLSRD